MLLRTRKDSNVRRDMMPRILMNLLNQQNRRFARLRSVQKCSNAKPKKLKRESLNLNSRLRKPRSVSMRLSTNGKELSVRLRCMSKS